MKSMTGFGKAIKETPTHQIEVEMKSVNQRFLDIQIRSPKVLNFLENDIRQLIKQKLNRGRIELFINLTPIGDRTKEVHVEWGLVDTLIEQLKKGAERHQTTDFSVGRVLENLVTQDTYVSVKELSIDEEYLESNLVEVVQEALQNIEYSREKEGALLKQVLFENKVEFSRQLDELAQNTQAFEEEYEERFQQKLTDYLGNQVDQTRLLTELAILLERGDIHEEIDRLRIHLNNVDHLLSVSHPVGRELDFLVQEMNREVNTIGSKSARIEIKNHVVQMKTMLEKIREQIQNIE